MALPTVRQLTYLIAVADAGRFNLAAERAHISQPALSEQIAQLEHNLGAKLFERGRAGAKLTPLGAEIAARARMILADLQELEDVVRANRESLGGLVRLGALPTVGPYLLPQVIPDLHGRYPDLRLYVREGQTVDLEARLRMGEFDVILSTAPEPADGLTIARLFKEPLRIGLTRGHPLAAKRTVAVEDLAGENLLTLEIGHYLAARVRALAARSGARVLVDYEGTSLDALRQMVGMGMGASVFPGLYERSEMLDEDAVVVRDLAVEEPWRWIVLAWRASSPRGADFQKLADMLRERAVKLLGEAQAGA